MTFIKTDRRRILTGGAAMLAGAIGLRQAAAQTTAAPIKENPTVPAAEYAIFTEFSPASKLLKAGWNTRVFTDTDTRKGSGIQCDFATGIVTLAPGAYSITGLSTVAYDSGGEPAEMTTVRAPASAGYARLRTLGTKAVVNPGMRDIDNADPSVICIGSVCTANLASSLVEAYYETDKTARILLEHQSGSNPEQIYLRVFTQSSRWHAMARINIRRL
jgi:hypothetical protein